MSFPAIHALFDFLAWAVSLTALLLLRRTWFSERPVEKHLRFGYLVGVLFGVSGAMMTIFYAFAGRVAEIRDEDW